MTKKFAVFASGHGSNLQAIIDAVKSGQIRAELALVFSDRPGAYALTRAQAAGIATLHIDPAQYADRQDFERAIAAALRERKIDFIVLAGYMKLITGYLIAEYPDRILNVHPALLPAFKGTRSIRDAFDSGVKVTGVTVHFVDEQMDNGPVILQEAVGIADDDTPESLEAKIHAVEHTLYPRAVALFAEDRLKMNGRKVVVRG